ncbi:MAG: serine/threonine protein kinase [Planctomycetes bacterium]|nr:serine/threonine protein kinase [Planctomycetota bacterium]
MPSSSRWSEVRAAFERVVELPPDERAAELARICGLDSGLRAEIEGLLAADSEDGLPNAVAMPSALGSVAESLAQAGALAIEGFVVRRLIATGGMGAVYEAEQQQPRRLVALKVLRPELCSGATLQRFRVEAEILGRLQHPGIAEVYAAGVHGTRSGPFELELPWYALELLASARSLTAHARQHGLDARARIALLQKVCEAVHHAHLRGVIHRDLKPGNVLVGEDGTPKIVDFGIARVAGDPSTENLTRTGVVLGTPAYMAPEQRNAEPDVDLRCDVYALGVVLFELLTDSLPEGAAAKSDLRPRAVRPDLDVELDWIVGTATALERDRRYPSALAMADDLGRHLRAEDVTAAPPSRIYRLRKAIRRHRAFLATVATVVVALAGGLTASLMALERARAAEALAKSEKTTADELRVETERANTELVEQSEVASGVVAIFRSSVTRAIGKDEGRDSTIADLCAELEGLIDSAAYPIRVRAGLCTILAQVRVGNGDPAAAARLDRRALEFLDQSGRLETKDAIVVRGNLADTLRAIGETASADAELELALDLCSRLLEPDDPDALNTKARRVMPLFARGDLATAETVAREVLDARLRVLGPDGHEVVDARRDVLFCLTQSGSHEAAIAFGQEALDEASRVLGAAHQKTLRIANNLAVSYGRTKRVSEAIAVLDPRIDPARAELPAGHPDLLEAQSTLAGLLLLTNARLDRAAELAMDVLEQRRARLGDVHADVLRAARLCARVQSQAGRAADALATLDRHVVPFATCPAPSRAAMLELHVARVRAILASAGTDAARAEAERVRAELATALPGDPLAERFATTVEQFLAPQSGADRRER